MGWAGYDNVSPTNRGSADESTDFEMAAAAPAPAPAAAPATGKRKRDLSEDDVYLILHKYSPTQVLTVLQEVSQHAERRRIDWRALVAKTATGITSARDYQMLWRYLAYGHDFVELVDQSAQPLGDESDLECEIEPSPTPSSEALAEASGFAKILMYGSSREQASSHRANPEVAVLNTPNEKIPRVPSDKQLGQSHRLTNGTGPVSNSKQASYTGLSLDPFDGNGPHKKKKKPKPWSKEEDADLTTGVHKCGEGNWHDILHKYSFDSARTAIQLSQRWAVISKRQGTTKPVNAKPASNFDIKATQKAFSMALGMPVRRPGLSALRTGISQQSTQHHAPVSGTATAELKSATSSSSLPLPVPVPVSAPVPVPVQVQMPLPQVQQAPAQVAPLRVSNTSNKSRNNTKKQAAQANLTNAPSSIQAAAIAAGGRIATPSVATNLLKAAQSTKAVHIRSRGTGSSKTSASSKSSTMAGESGPQPGSAQHPELPNCSAPAPSPSVLTTQSTEQVNVVPEVAGVNPPEQSASANLLEGDRTLSTTPVSGPCDSMEIDDDSTFCVVTMEDLFPEDVKQPDIVDPKAEEIIDPKAEEIIDPKADDIIDPKAEDIIDSKDADMLEFDRFVAQGCLGIDKSIGVRIAPGAQAAIASQKKQPKQLPTAGKSIPIFTAATMKKTKTLGSHGATFPPTVTSGGLVGTGNAGVLSKALGGQPTGPGTAGKQNRCQEIMSQKQHATNSKSNGMTKIAAPGAGTPARNAASSAGTLARNVAPGTGTLASNAVPGAGVPARNVAGSAVAQARNAAPIAGTPARNAATGTGAAVRNVSPGTGTLAKNTPPVAGAAARIVSPGTGTLGKIVAPGAGAPLRNASPGTGTLAKNTPPGVRAAARNVSPGTGTVAKNSAPATGAAARSAAPGTGALAKNTAPATGPPARNVAPGTGSPANRQYNLVVKVNNGASKGNPPASK
ncbi:uncharacterized protein LOC124690128 [Lolium rigidum]|uniref:uncharacterized protein LOC124690128 n=1 Tax=Lolium rigidum TaxID=89674 RepID=UPI001F5C454E|nr:uncharacterized protein LOC124690128 [Lolium rigidum]